MFKVTKGVWYLSLLLFVIIAIGIAGCSRGNTTEPAVTSPPGLTTPAASGAASTPAAPPSQAPSLTAESPALSSPAPAPAAQDIISRTKDAWAGLTSYGYDFNMEFAMSGTISGKTQNFNITMSGNSVNNLTISAMQMNANMEIESPGQGKISMPMILYLVNGWEYTKISIPLAGDQWTKTQLDMGSYDAMDDVQHVLEMGQSGVEVTVAGSEDIDGVSCYVLQINPDPAELSKWLKSVQQTADIQGNEPSDADLSNAIKKLSFKEWIAKDGYLLKKSETSATVNMNGSQLGSSAEATDNLNMNISEVLALTQYNQPVSIVLPPESQDAQDVTSQQSGAESSP
jgi:hypothetical protein